MPKIGVEDVVTLEANCMVDELALVPPIIAT
jgi:hypothetical protein